MGPVLVGLVVGAVVLVVLLIVAAAIVAIGWLRFRRGTTLSFVVGEQEQHDVVLFYSKFAGRLAIDVDGEGIVREVATPSLELDSREFRVRTHEGHVVRIDKHREKLFSAFRPHPVRAYVDGRLVAEPLPDSVVRVPDRVGPCWGEKNFGCTRGIVGALTTSRCGANSPSLTSPRGSGCRCNINYSMSRAQFRRRGADSTR
jgi:hypothetical protein